MDTRVTFITRFALVALTMLFPQALIAQQPIARNPLVFADVPDLSVIRVGKVYYMSSTTMHMSPGLPIMKSDDLINWRIVNYAYDTLADTDALNLANGKDAYAKGTWASSLRFHDGVYYVTTFSQTTGKTYVFTTADIEKGPWSVSSFVPSLHDHTLFFDDDGRVYMIYGAGKLKLVELTPDAKSIKPGTPELVVIENASAPAGEKIGLPAEGSQLFKVNGKYYLFNIVWPKGGMRTVLVHRADKIQGPYEGRVALQDRGVAQGGLVDTPEGKWFAYLFRDYGSVGRIPYLVPVEWRDGWPILGIDGQAPATLPVPVGNDKVPAVVASDEFDRHNNDRPLPLVWQWNHNPVNSLWSVRERKGYLRLKTGRIDSAFVHARNTLTQRTTGARSTAIAALDISGMKDGDFAGLALLQKKFGQVGVEITAGKRHLIMVNAESGKPVKSAPVPLQQAFVFLKASCDFTDMKHTATFSYSLDGQTWHPIGTPLKMSYTLPHFMGYRFGLFNYATKQPGGYADFDFFRISGER